jgi:hypothetical protein
MAWYPYPQIVVIIIVIGIFIGGVFALSEPSSQFTKARTLCDEAVTSLLYSKDMVEVIRGGLIVRQLDCGISKRLP